MEKLNLTNLTDGAKAKLCEELTMKLGVLLGLDDPETLDVVSK